MKHFQALTLMISVLLLSSLALNIPPSTWQVKVDPLLLSAAPQEEQEFLIILQQQTDLSAAVELPTKIAKGQYVHQRLSAAASESQASLIQFLEARQLRYRSFWIVNLIWSRGRLADIQLLASQPGVARILANPRVRLDLPPESPDTIRLGPSAPAGIEWNLQKVSAPAVWAAGITGQGAVIAGADTGYQWDHPALIDQYRGWTGSTVDHSYNWHDAIHTDNTFCPADSPEPCDDYGHGTHTMGTMLGDDSSANQIGMAPGARWIACRNMDSGYGTPASYLECFQWFLAPTDANDQNPRPDLAPDVINNSWACPPGEGCDPSTLEQAVDSLRQAGIVVVASAGNNGAFGCGSVDDPPAIYQSSFVVGATDSLDNIVSFSSRGPADNTGLLKPDISAPGVGVRSSFPQDRYKSWGGTSMAAPHVSGLVALIISADPSLRGDVAAIEDLVRQNAIPRQASQDCGGVPGTQIPNNTFGWGRIDAAKTVGKITPHRLALEIQASPSTVIPSEVLVYTLQITHQHPSTPDTHIIVSDPLPAGTSFLDATQPYSLQDGVVRWELTGLAPIQAVTLQLKVRVDSDASGTIENSAYQAYSDQTPTPVTGPPLQTAVWQPFFLPFTARLR